MKSKTIFLDAYFDDVVTIVKVIIMTGFNNLRNRWPPSLISIFSLHFYLFLCSSFIISLTDIRYNDRCRTECLSSRIYIRIIILQRNI